MLWGTFRGRLLALEKVYCVGGIVKRGEELNRLQREGEVEVDRGRWEERGGVGGTDLAAGVVLWAQRRVWMWLGGVQSRREREHGRGWKRREKRRVKEEAAARFCESR